MKRVGLLMILAAILATPVGVSDGLAQAHPTAPEVDAIRALMVETTDAFNRHDAKAWARFCTPDAQLVTVRGESMKGVAEIEKGLAAIFDGRGRAARLKTLDIAVRFVRPDVGLAHVTNEMSGVTAPDGRSLPPHRELSIRVVVREQGAWHITAFHNTIVQRSRFSASC
jgi:uncharacterized protein (TIGR02246 family)